MQVVQISDSHIALSSPQRGDDLHRCIECINALQPQPALVIHCGDITHNGRDEEYTIAQQLLAHIHAPLLLMAGNKDRRDGMLKAFADERYLTPGMPFIQYSVEDFPVRLIILDTLADNINKGQLCEARMAHLQQMLEQDSDRPVHIFMHHPPFEAHEIPEPRQFNDWSEVDAFSAMVARYPTIQHIWCGHVHRNIESSTGGVAVSAISCLAHDLRKGEMTHHERTMPMFRQLQLG